MRQDGKIDYVEFPAADLSEIKRFYGEAFGWDFQDYGPSYVAFEGQGTDGGFSSDPAEAPAKPIVVLFAHDLEAIQRRIRAAGGVITRPIFSFPGGRRFHFRDPSGNELGVWSET
jgi:predicted enzyme related to lactoylglutathione lyase